MTASPRSGAAIAHDIAAGAVAGLVGGAAFGLAWLELGVLPSIATLIRAEGDIVGLIVHMAIAAIVGAGLGLLMRGRRSAGDTVLWGVTYAAFFWFLGPMTLQPIIFGTVPAWDVAAAQAGFPSLLGHVIYGAVAGLTLATLTAWQRTRPAALNEEIPARDDVPDSGTGGRRLPRGLIARGLLAGTFAFVVVSFVLLGQDQMLSTSSLGATGGTTILGPLLISSLFGLLFGLAHPVSAPTAGASLVRGTGFGFLLWVVGGLTLLPLLRGEGLMWSVPDARLAFPALVGSILLGATTGLVFHWLTRLTPIFFSDDDPDTPPDGGSWGLRAVVRGAGAGLVGALLFTLVMLQIGYLPAVAGLVGSDSEIVGLLVHLLIGMTIGATFGLLFRRQAFDAGAAVGWGVAYGFIWWLLGPLTLAPMIAGTEPAWTVAAAAGQFPGLIGHLAYGAGLGITFYLLEARYAPWWISRSERELQRMAGRRQAASSAGPALWAMLVLVAVLLPTVLSAPMPDELPDVYGSPSDAGAPYAPSGSRPTIGS